MPPTHHHYHDYCLTIDDRYPVVVGEAMSGENYPDELQKCMLGVMKMLNIYETTISMTSSSSMCDISYYHLGHQLVYSGVQYPVIAGPTIKCRCSGSEDEYPNYILKILVCLETAIMGWLNTNGGVVVAAEPATIGTQKSGGVEFESGTKVNVPGVYCRNNFPWVAENTVTMMSMYLRDHKNKKEERPYPFALRQGNNRFAPVPVIMKGITVGKPLVIVSKSKADGKAQLVQVPHLDRLEKVNMGQKLHEDGTEEDQDMET